MTAAAPAGEAPSGERLLAQRGLRLLWLGETTSKVGSTVSGIALPLVALVTLHASTFAVALLTAAAWLPWLVVGLPAGAWVDRLPGRPLMIGCDVASLLLMVSVPAAARLGVLTVPQLLVVALLVGVATVFFATAYQVYLPALVAEPDLPGANALLQGSESAAQVAGPTLGGLLTQALGAVAGVLVDAISYAVSAICLLRLRRAPHHGTASERPVERGSLRAEIGTGLRFVLGDPYLRVNTIFGALSNLSLNAYGAILVAFLIRTLGVSPGLVGVLLSASLFGGVLGAALAPWLRDRLGSAYALLACKAGVAPAALLIPLAQPGWRLVLVVLGGLIPGIGFVAGNVINGAWRQAYVPRELMGRAVVSMQFLNFGAIPVGAVLGGLGAATLGIRPTMWCSTAGVAVAALVLGLRLQHLTARRDGQPGIRRG